MPETEHLHTVTITGTEDDPRIEFVCHGGRDAVCHSYPDCECEEYILGDSHDGEGHPFVAHDACWLTSWFDKGSTDPCVDTLGECDLRPGMSGPIKEWFEGDHVFWEFANARLAAIHATAPDIEPLEAAAVAELNERPDEDACTCPETVDGRCIGCGVYHDGLTEDGAA